MSGPTRRPWTEAEDIYLMERWGNVSIPSIAKALNRTTGAVRLRATSMNMGPMLMGGDYVTLSQLIKTVTGSQDFAYGYKMQSWVERRGLPVHRKKVINCSFRVVYLKEFWRWAEANRSFLDFSRMEPLALGEEPEWVNEQRKKDFGSIPLQRKNRWTPEDDSRLIMLLKQHRYGYAELSEIMNRSVGSILKRCSDLGLKERPVRVPSNGSTSYWTDEYFAILADGIRAGDSYTAIGRKIGKSEKAVRGKVYTTYCTESADKVRAMMGNGPFGNGAPVPTVAQGIHLSGRKRQVKKELKKLCEILRRMAE